MSKDEMEKHAEACKKEGKKFIFATLDYKQQNGGTLLLDADLNNKDLSILLSAICKDKETLIALGITVGNLLNSLKK